jgi:hypothetical protein
VALGTQDPPHSRLTDLVTQTSQFLCVPKTSSMSCDLGVLVNEATETITPPDLDLI